MYISILSGSSFANIYFKKLQLTDNKTQELDFKNSICKYFHYHKLQKEKANCNNTKEDCI